MIIDLNKMGASTPKGVVVFWVNHSIPSGLDSA